MNNMNSKNIHNCIIIGSGPAGYSAAIYASRADLKPIIYTGEIPGGQLINTTKIDNYAGVYGITGMELIKKMEQQCKYFGVLIKYESIIHVYFTNKKGGRHCLYTDNEKQIYTKGVIIATGASPKYLGLKSENKLKGLGVSVCATCDGPEHKQKNAIL
jgi:thioredoxin reductase (NADPH)